MCEIDSQTKKEKLQLHYILRGNGFRRIARIMSKIFNKNYRYQTIMNWIQRAGLKVLSEKKQEKVEVLEVNKGID